VRCISRTHVLSNLLFRYSLVPRLSSAILFLFSELPSCIPNPMSLFSSLTGSSRVRRVEWSPTDIRYSITGHRISLRINYKLLLVSVLFVNVANILDLIIPAVIFVSFKQPYSNSVRYANASPIQPLNCDHWIML